MTFAPLSSRLANTRRRPDGTPRAPRTPFARFAALLAGAALFCAPHAWAQVAEGDDFKRHYVSGGAFNYGVGCEAEVDKLYADIREAYNAANPSNRIGGGIECSASLSHAAGAYGYRFTKRWGMEAGYIIGPEVELALAFSSEGGQRIAFGVAADVTTLYAAGTVRFGGRWVQGYALAGLASWNLDYGALVAADSNRGDFSDTALESDSGTGPIYGLGALFYIGRGFGVNLGFKAVTGALPYLGLALVWSF